MKITEKRIEESGEPVFTKGAVLPSLTDMRDCTHGPKANCHKCLIPELVRVLRCLMPLNVGGECCYCAWGSVVQEDGHHFDADNIWDGDPICLNDPYYDDARAVLDKAKQIEDCIEEKK